jgi:hypothetical protein
MGQTFVGRIGSSFIKQLRNVQDLSDLMLIKALPYFGLGTTYLFLMKNKYSKTRNL